MNYCSTTWTKVHCDSDKADIASFHPLSVSEPQSGVSLPAFLHIVLVLMTDAGLQTVTNVLQFGNHSKAAAVKLFLIEGKLFSFTFSKLF